MAIEPITDLVLVDQEELALLDYLKHSRSFDFTGYKRTSLFRRLSRRMAIVNVQSYSEYIDYLEVHPDEFEQLFNTILINVTSFFRDPQAWEVVENVVLPRILFSRSDETPIRIWSAGCASGEEPYTMIMLLAEKLGVEAVRDQVKLYATDIDEEALREARQAVYSARSVGAIPEHLIDKYFTLNGDGYTFNSELRRSVIFGRHDLINDAPISRIDMLICRNTLMYFNAEIQTRVLSRFHFALNPSAVLVLGKAEMLFTHSNLFTPLDLKRRIFAKSPKAIPSDRAYMVAYRDGDAADGSEPAPPSISMGNWKAIFDVTPGAQIVVDRNGFTVLINNRARNQFRLSDKDVGRPLQDLELSYRPVDLRSLIDQAYQEQRPAVLKDISHSVSSGRNAEVGYLDVQVAPVADMYNMIEGVVITFSDVTRYRQLQDELQEANRELETAYDELQSTNEELETTNEELQSTVEELETTNEELQSTNEELETMNEELQSTNEELQAINEEHRQQGTELKDVNAFMSSILSNLNAGVVVLDREMHVLVWNSLAEEMWGLRQDEAVGRHFLTLDIGLPVDQLKTPIRAALGDESRQFEQDIEAVNRRGKQLQLKVQVSPLSEQPGSEQRVLLVMEAL